MQLIVVHNAEAGAGQMTRARVEQLLRGAGHDAEINDRNDGRWQTRPAEAPDAIAAVGGDGTEQKAIHEALGTDIPVAILPAGTANNIAHSLGYTVGDPLPDRVAHWLDREQRVPLASAARNGWEASFIESVGVGVFADMVAGHD